MKSLIAEIVEACKHSIGGIFSVHSSNISSVTSLGFGTLWSILVVATLWKRQRRNCCAFPASGPAASAGLWSAPSGLRGLASLGLPLTRRVRRHRRPAWTTSSSQESYFSHTCEGLSIRSDSQAPGMGMWVSPGDNFQLSTQLFRLYSTHILQAKSCLFGVVVLAVLHSQAPNSVLFTTGAQKQRPGFAPYVWGLEKPAKICSQGQIIQMAKEESWTGTKE